MAIFVKEDGEWKRMQVLNYRAEQDWSIPVEGWVLDENSGWELFYKKPEFGGGADIPEVNDVIQIQAIKPVRDVLQNASFSDTTSPRAFAAVQLNLDTSNLPNVETLLFKDETFSLPYQAIPIVDVAMGKHLQFGENPADVGLPGFADSRIFVAQTNATQFGPPSKYPNRTPEGEFVKIHVLSDRRYDECNPGEGLKLDFTYDIGEALAQATGGQYCTISQIEKAPHHGGFFALIRTSDAKDRIVELQTPRDPFILGYEEDTDVFPPLRGYDLRLGDSNVLSSEPAGIPNNSILSLIQSFDVRPKSDNPEILVGSGGVIGVNNVVTVERNANGEFVQQHLLDLGTHGYGSAGDSFTSEGVINVQAYDSGSEDGFIATTSVIVDDLSDPFENFKRFELLITHAKETSTTPDFQHLEFSYVAKDEENVGEYRHAAEIAIDPNSNRWAVVTQIFTPDPTSPKATVLNIFKGFGGSASLVKKITGYKGEDFDERGIQTVLGLEWLSTGELILSHMAGSFIFDSQAPDNRFEGLISLGSKGGPMAYHPLSNTLAMPLGDEGRLQVFRNGVTPFIELQEVLPAEDDDGESELGPMERIYLPSVNEKSESFENYGQILQLRNDVVSKPSEFESKKLEYQYRVFVEFLGGIQQEIRPPAGEDIRTFDAAPLEETCGEVVYYGFNYGDVPNGDPGYEEGATTLKGSVTRFFGTRELGLLELEYRDVPEGSSPGSWTPSRREYDFPSRLVFDSGSANSEFPNVDFEFTLFGLSGRYEYRFRLYEKQDKDSNGAFIEGKNLIAETAPQEFFATTTPTTLDNLPEDLVLVEGDLNHDSGNDPGDFGLGAGMSGNDNEFVLDMGFFVDDSGDGIGIDENPPKYTVGNVSFMNVTVDRAANEITFSSIEAPDGAPNTKTGEASVQIDVQGPANMESDIFSFKIEPVLKLGDVVSELDANNDEILISGKSVDGNTTNRRIEYDTNDNFSNVDPTGSNDETSGVVDVNSYVTVSGDNDTEFSDLSIGGLTPGGTYYVRLSADRNNKGKFYSEVRTVVVKGFDIDLIFSGVGDSPPRDNTEYQGMNGFITFATFDPKQSLAAIETPTVQYSGIDGYTLRFQKRTRTNDGSGYVFGSWENVTESYVDDGPVAMTFGTENTFGNPVDLRRRGLAARKIGTNGLANESNWDTSIGSNPARNTWNTGTALWAVEAKWVLEDPSGTVVKEGTPGDMGELKSVAQMSFTGIDPDNDGFLDVEAKVFLRELPDICNAGDKVLEIEIVNTDGSNSETWVIGDLDDIPSTGDPEVFEEGKSFVRDYTAGNTANAIVTLYENQTDANNGTNGKVLLDDQYSI